MRFFQSPYHQWPGRTKFSKSKLCVMETRRDLSQNFSRLLIQNQSDKKTRSYCLPFRGGHKDRATAYACVKKGPGTEHQSSANISSSSTQPSASPSASTPLSSPSGSSSLSLSRGASTGDSGLVGSSNDPGTLGVARTELVGTFL